MNARRTSARTATFAAGLAAAFCLLMPSAIADSQPPAGSHVPATVAAENGTLECDSIPPDRDPEIARIVYDVGVERGADDRVLLSAMEAGWVESHMNNLDCGDADSLGVFQQRPSQGWGTPEQIMDPVYASNKYYDQAIPNAANNPSWTAGQVAQSVQRSAYPERYDQAEPKAREMIAEITG